MLVQDFIDGWSTDHTDKAEYFQNFEIYIGDYDQWYNNQKCAGGPFMDLDDYEEDYYRDYGLINFKPGYVWNYGREVWCNMQGQYVFIVADLSHLRGDYYKMSLCNLGIMGTRYVRDESFEESIEIIKGNSISILVPHVYSELPIANELEINLRLAS